MFYNPDYSRIQVNLWVFINDDDFDKDNYASYELGPDYTHYISDQHALRLTDRPVPMRAMQTITRQPIQMVQVDTKQLQTNKGTVKVMVPRGEVQRVYSQGPQAVQKVIAPAFAQQGRQFKGQSSKIQTPIAKVSKQENSAGAILTLAAKGDNVELEEGQRLNVRMTADTSVRYAARR